MASENNRSVAQLRILNPCFENWDEMAPQGPGRFCDTCKHTVLDLSCATQDEAKQLLEANPKLTCVKLRRDKSGVPVFRPPSKSSVRWLALGLSLLAACGGKRAGHDRALMGKVAAPPQPPSHDTVIGDFTEIGDVMEIETIEEAKTPPPKPTVSEAPAPDKNE